MEKVYLDHAATTPLDPEVFEKMKPYFLSEFGNSESLHSFGRDAMLAVDAARDSIAKNIGANYDEVYFSSCGTECDNWALRGLAHGLKKTGRKKILVSSIEHHAVLSSADVLKEEGFDVEYIPCQRSGKIDVEWLKNALTDEVSVVAVMGANNESGVIQPMQEIGALAHAVGAVYFADCVQYAPYRRIDVKTLGADVVVFSAHKFYGPKGCGILYVKRGVRIDRLIAGGEQERGMRGGTLNVPAIVGAGFAYEKALKNLEENNRKIASLRALFLEKTKAIGGEVLGKDEERIESVLSYRLDGVRSDEFIFSADLEGIALSAGSACASHASSPSHVLSAMGLSEEEARSVLRFSFGKHNTEEQIEYAAKKTMEIVERIKNA